MLTSKKPQPAILILFGLLLIHSSTNTAQAHCDRINGPVAEAAREALATGAFTTIAIWVGDGQAAELEERFRQVLPVYKMGGQARELAERYFMETAVRLHREAEGVPYAGLQPAAPPEPEIAAAEKALETGDLKPVTGMLGAEMEKEAEKWFRTALQARKKYQADNVQAGREWVDAYVKYITYVHGLHQTIKAGPAHGVEE